LFIIRKNIFNLGFFLDYLTTVNNRVQPESCEITGLLRITVGTWTYAKIVLIFLCLLLDVVKRKDGLHTVGDSHLEIMLGAE
jgi:hypothetical protein